MQRRYELRLGRRYLLGGELELQPCRVRYSALRGKERRRFPSLLHVLISGRVALDSRH